MKENTTNQTNGHINYGYYFNNYESTTSRNKKVKDDYKISKIDGGLKRMIIFSLLSAGIIFLKTLIF